MGKFIIITQSLQDGEIIRKKSIAEDRFATLCTTPGMLFSKSPWEFGDSEYEFYKQFERSVKRVDSFHWKCEYYDTNSKDWLDHVKEVIV